MPLPIYPALNAFGFISKHWRILVALGALVVMYLYWADRTNQIEQLRKTEADLRAEIVLKDSQFAENKRRYEKEIADQNAKIRQANTEYQQLQSKIEILVAQETARNDERVRKLEEQLNILRSLPTPQTCEASVALLVDIGVANKWPVTRN